MKGPFAFTQGNVISNLQSSPTTGRSLLRHETTHIMQNRIFGPIFPTTYVVWVIVGAIVGNFLEPDSSKSVEDVAYYDNPWEQWSYAHGGSDGGKGKFTY